MTTARVNLLPHREERRKAARQHFFVVAGGTAVLGAMIVLAMHTFYAAKIEIQQERNRFLKSETETSPRQEVSCS
jgi:type IV pilus assembly protein PilN